jgi:hypothetical protein
MKTNNDPENDATPRALAALVRPGDGPTGQLLGVAEEVRLAQALDALDELEA